MDVPSDRSPTRRFIIPTSERRFYSASLESGLMVTPGTLRNISAEVLELHQKRHLGGTLVRNNRNNSRLFPTEPLPVSIPLTPPHD